ncbi:FAR1-RELATED SEQUENCE 3 protein [Nymphaea thermarum]|nr:FAR1-RELATED SEQUENCE 3 protein [Nymphaea thermarum]
MAGMITDEKDEKIKTKTPVHVHMDDDGYAANVFWADSMSTLDYGLFSDFVGVNYHSKSCIFDSTLCLDQTTERFKWLFKVLTKAMNEKHPKVVPTDSGSAIAVAVSLIWP